MRHFGGHGGRGPHACARRWARYFGSTGSGCGGLGGLLVFGGRLLFFGGQLVVARVACDIAVQAQ
jgi:hypothetical protein